MKSIKVFSLAECGIEREHFIGHIKKYYKEYECDEYLYRQDVINKLVKDNILSFSQDTDIIESFYLSGDFSYFNRLKINLELYSNIIKYRKRLVCSFNITKDKKVKRFFPNEFNQAKAERVDRNFDFRLYPRVFKEAPDKMVNSSIIKLLEVFSSKIFKEMPDCQNLLATVHFTLIEAVNQGNSSNSPEGIHQDGMDFIVSALVLERYNIVGGVSNIYYPDTSNKLLNVELQEGFGLFHKDLNTNFWHEVTQIRKKNEDDVGYRSTIGFDFEVVK